MPELLKEYSVDSALAIGTDAMRKMMQPIGPSWLGQITGRKRWYISKKDGYDGNIDDSNIQTCAEKPTDDSIECTVNEGEIIYIPGNRAHGTCNLDKFTLGFGGRCNWGICLNGKSEDTAEWDQRFSPPLFAASQGNVEQLRALAQAGYEMARKEWGPEGKAVGLPLHFAAKSGSLDAVKLLVEEQKLDVNGVDQAGKSPIHYAALGSHIAVVEYLASQGADVNAGGLTPLMIGGSWGHAELIEWLVQHGAKVNLQTGDLENMSALQVAVESNRQVAAATLLALGADPQLKRQDGKSALDMATENGGWLDAYVKGTKKLKHTPLLKVTSAQASAGADHNKVAGNAKLMR